MAENPIDGIIEEFQKDKRFKDRQFRKAKDLPKIDVIPTGIPELDQAVLGIGGLPCGRIVEMWGPKSCGKSTLAGSIIGHMQQQKLGHYGGTAAIFDTEGKFDASWWERWGVDTSRVFTSDFTCGEDAYDQIMRLLGKIDIVILDSIAMLLSKEEATRGEAKQRMGSEARMNKTKLLQVINGTLDKDKFGNIKDYITPKLVSTKTIFIVINQIRANIGIMFGSKERKPSGHIVDHIASVLLRMDRIGYGKARDGSAGIQEQKVRIRADKNVFAPPLRQCDVWLSLDECKFKISNLSFLLNTAIDKGFVEKRGKGAWLYCDSFPDGKLQGSKQFIHFLTSSKGAKLKKEIFGDMELPTIEEEEEIIIEEIDEDIIEVIGEGAMEG